MSEEDTGNELEETMWFVDLDWLKESNRSFSTVAQRSLCNKCRKKLKIEKGEISASKLIDALKSCCSKEKNYISSELPVMESVFRLLLAGGNEPVSLLDLGEQLRQKWGGSPGTTSPEILYRLMMNDRFYGFNHI
ncbi:hypothetical protein ACFLUG_01930 [Chloroflexota bacterium]